jgi:hypothetical protein
MYFKMYADDTLCNGFSSHIEIDTQGGHLLAPQNWDRAESFSGQNPSAGVCHNVGIYHIFVSLFNDCKSQNLTT